MLERPYSFIDDSICEGTDRGNKYKVEKELAAYDEDATLSIDLLCSLSNCNGRIAGECLRYDIHRGANLWSCH